MTYIAKDRFIQICAAAHPSKAADSLFALDEGGCVYRYNFEHSVWVALERTRGESAPRPHKEKSAQAETQAR